MTSAKSIELAVWPPRWTRRPDRRWRRGRRDRAAGGRALGRLILRSGRRIERRQCRSPGRTEPGIGHRRNAGRRAQRGFEALQPRAEVAVGTFGDDEDRSVRARSEALRDHVVRL